MNTSIIKAHFTDNSLLNPVHPITVNLIGIGGTGSKVLTALMEMHQSLLALGHAGLSVRAWDADIITSANIGRQRFAASETGLYKSVALINRINRFAGTDWKAATIPFQRDNAGRLPEQANASIFISCVDTVAARFEIAEMLTLLKSQQVMRIERPKYWLDFGVRHESRI